MEIRNIESVPVFITKDTSEIRELLAYRNSSITNQSLAEATIPVGAKTIAHLHRKTEEIYYITAGVGNMTIESETSQVNVGDAIAIPPGKIHQIENCGDVPLKLLCCCSPCYEHDDTVLYDDSGNPIQDEA